MALWRRRKLLQGKANEAATTANVGAEAATVRAEAAKDGLARWGAVMKPSPQTAAALAEGSAGHDAWEE